MDIFALLVVDSLSPCDTDHQTSSVLSVVFIRLVTKMATVTKMASWENFFSCIPVSIKRDSAQILQVLVHLDQSPSTCCASLLINRHTQSRVRERVCDIPVFVTFFSTVLFTESPSLHVSDLSSSPCLHPACFVVWNRGDPLKAAPTQCMHCHEHRPKVVVDWCRILLIITI